MVAVYGVPIGWSIWSYGRRSGSMVGFFEITPQKNWHDNGKSTIWTCIAKLPIESGDSLMACWCSAMLNGVEFLLSRHGVMVKLGFSGTLWSKHSSQIEPKPSQPKTCCFTKITHPKNKRNTRTNDFSHDNLQSFHGIPGKSWLLFSL